jgi:putative hydrolase of the HAD superfamily
MRSMNSNASNNELENQCGDTMNRIEGIKTISFDGDGTLWDFEKVMVHSLNEVLKELEKIEPEIASLLTIEKMITIRERVALQYKGKIMDLEKVRFMAFQETLKDIGRPNDDLAAHLNEVYLKHRFEDMELFDDVLPTLERLRKRYTIGLISNGNSYPGGSGLENIFQFTIFPRDTGVEKPDPRIFQHGLERAGCSKHEMLHVGDSVKDDIGGALKAGIRSVWLNREGAKDTSEHVIEYEIEGLFELLDLLDG